MEASTADLQSQLQYYRQLADELGATNIGYDARVAAATTEVRKLKEGLALLGGLQRRIDAQAPMEDVYNLTLQAINLSLRMDKSVVLLAEEEDEAFMRPAYSLGLDFAVQEALSQMRFHIGEALLHKEDYWLATKSQAAEGLLAEVGAALGISFFVAVPFYVHQRRAGILLSGRNKEIRPFFPPLGEAEVLLFQTVSAFLSVSATNSGAYHFLEKIVTDRTAELSAEKQKSDDLLLNILPAEVAAELKEKGSAGARHFDNVTVLFTDFVNFSGVAGNLTPEALVDELNTCFTAFDRIVSKHGIEKIKTVGDAYLAVCGLPKPAPDHAQRTIRAAIEIRDFMEARRAEKADAFEMRIGIHSGEVVAGIVGVKKFAYDIWGDTVNIAARMEQHGEPGRINLSGVTHKLLGEEYACTHRGKIAVKGRGEVDMYFLEERGVRL